MQLCFEFGARLWLKVEGKSIGKNHPCHAICESMRYERINIKLVLLMQQCKERLGKALRKPCKVTTARWYTGSCLMLDTNCSGPGSPNLNQIERLKVHEEAP